MNDELTRILAFIGAKPTKGVNAFMTTFRKTGEPYVRQVSTFIEGWTIGTISGKATLKMAHLLGDSRVQYLYVESCSETNRRRNVWLTGTITMTDDNDEIIAFLERRKEATGWPVVNARYERVLVKFTPQFLRAEGFREDSYTKQEPAFIAREIPAY